jgi:hypothetical protein
MLRDCALKHGGSWDKSLPFAEFSYKNSYQASLKMRLRHCMAGSAELRCIGVRQAKANCSGLRSLKRLSDRYRLSVRI